MPQSCNLRRPNQFPKNAACQFALIGLLGCPLLPTDDGCPPRPMPCGVAKPPTRLLVSIERLPMARHRPALDSTGTAPDRRQRLPNFTPFAIFCRPINRRCAFSPRPDQPGPRLRRNIPANSAVSPHRRNGEPVRPSTPKPARFRFQPLRQQPNARPITRLARCATGNWGLKTPQAQPIPKKRRLPIRVNWLVRLPCAAN